MSRIDGYGRIDRSRTLTITVDGVSYEGHPGDTVASVLLAHDAHPRNARVKLGRPRGIGGAWQACDKDCRAIVTRPRRRWLRFASSLPPPPHDPTS